MLPIPEMNNVDVAFSNTKHMPKYEDVPDEFKRSGNPYVQFISHWFFRGLKAADMERLVPKEGVDSNKALRAVRAVLESFDPKHEHKEAGCAYMLSQWFDLKDEAKAA